MNEVDQCVEDESSLKSKLNRSLIRNRHQAVPGLCNNCEGGEVAARQVHSVRITV